MKCNFYPFFKYNNTYFTSSARSREVCNVEILSDSGPVFNTTGLFRGDVDWFFLARFLNRNFQNNDRVNVYNFACSDGSEPYTLAIALNEVNMIAEKRNKFLPIIASDIDSEIISLAKSGKINLRESEIKSLDGITTSRYPYFTNPDFSLQIDNDMDIDSYKSYRANSYLKNAVSFRNDDMLKQLKDIEDKGNTVILCRNVFPYLKENYSKNVLDLLNSKLKANSIVVLGDIDRENKLRDSLSDNFECIDNRNIYRKVK